MSHKTYKKQSIAIIGAGISGLSAAYELGKKGYKVTVYEASAVPGGLGTYLEVGGNHIERFYHHFFESDIFLRNMAAELGIDSKLKFYRVKTGVYRNKTIFSFSSPMDLLRFKPLSFINRIRCGISMGYLKIRSKPNLKQDSVSAASWIKKYAGLQVYNNLWGPLLEGKFSQFSQHIPTIWLWGRIHDRTLRLGYFDGSAKVLFDKLISEIEKSGGVIKLSTGVEKIVETKSHVNLTISGKTNKYESCIITTVSPIADKLITSILSAHVRRRLRNQDHLGAVCLLLELSKPVQSQYWLNICDPNESVLAVVEHTNLIPSSEYGNKNLVYLANYIHRDDPRFALSERTIVNQYTKILKKLNPKFDKSWILNQHLSRVPRTQTIFKVGDLNTRPPVQLSKKLFMINIDQMYPHDRNLNQGIELGKKVATYF